MSESDRKLLLIDISARLPYGLICQVSYKEDGTWHKKDMIMEGVFPEESYFTTDRGSTYSNELKPYLRPLTSLTEDELKEYNSFSSYGASGVSNEFRIIRVPNFLQLDWLNANHVDYRGMIEKDLAIAVTEDYDPYKGIVNKDFIEV